MPDGNKLPLSRAAAHRLPTFWLLDVMDDFGALHCQPAQKFDRSTKLDLTAALANVTYALLWVGYFSRYAIPKAKDTVLMRCSKPYFLNSGFVEK
mgnify:CR=1 FL=1